MVLDRRSFTLGLFEPPPAFFTGDSEDSAKNRLRKPLEGEDRDLSTSAGMEASETAGFSWRSEADASEEDEEEESRRRWAEAERRRNMGKREPPPSEFGAKLESAFESSEVFREPEGVLVGLRAKTGTSVKCSEGIRI